MKQNLNWKKQLLQWSILPLTLILLFFTYMFIIRTSDPCRPCKIKDGVQVFDHRVWCDDAWRSRNCI